LVDMDLYQKISILGPSAQYDTCGPKDFATTTNIPGVYHAKLAGNRVCRLFKVLQTNLCINNCRYCAFRSGRSCTRTTATADEMAKAFDSAYSRRLVDGFFLSSGIQKNADYTMSRLLDTAVILRKKYQYRGYLHLKIMPGSSDSCVANALRLANRVSLNIESPTESTLAELSPDKDLKKGFYNTLNKIKKQLRRLKLAGQRTPSLTTQFVIGAGQETDAQVIRATFHLYQNFGLSRVFYSAFRPVSQTPLEHKPAESLTREHRLYQSDFLMRFYKFKPWQIPLDANGRLLTDVDPKMAWAKLNPQVFPINLNKARFYDLLKIPGLGPTGAQKIIKVRGKTKINSLDKLKNQRLQLEKIKKFVCF